MITNLIFKSNNKKIWKIISLVLIILHIANANSVKFSHTLMNPFSDYIMANFRGGILRTELDLKESKWELFTIKKPVIEHLQDTYLIYLKFEDDYSHFLIREYEMKANKAFIEKGDFIYYISKEFPLVVLFGTSHEYNPLFDMNVTGLLNIEDALNEHLKNHPVTYNQEINMVKMEQNELNISHMGFIYNSNQEILDHKFHLGGGQYQMIKEMFHANFELENIGKKVGKWIEKMKDKIYDLMKEFLLTNIDSKDFNSILHPTDKNTEALKLLYDTMKNKMDLVVLNEERLQEFEVQFIIKTLKVIKELKKIINNLLLESSINIFFNSVIYDKPNLYFPDRFEIDGAEFTVKYSEIFLNKFFPLDTVDEIEGGFVELLKMTFNECKVEYSNVIIELNRLNKYDNIKQFENALDKLFINLISPKSILYKVMHLRMRNAMFYYMDRMMRFSQVNDTGVMISGTRFVNIVKIGEIMKYFGPDRNFVRVGYPVSFELFNLQHKDKKTSLMRMSTTELDNELDFD